MDILGLLRREAATHGSRSSVLFLTPCHATPYYAHMHANVPMRFLDCSPAQHAAAAAQLNRRSQAWLALPDGCPHAPGTQLSQRQCFELDPAAYLSGVLQGPSQLPLLLVGYSPLMTSVADVLERWGYRLHTRLTNCWVQTDEDSPCQLELWRRL